MLLFLFPALAALATFRSTLAQQPVTLIASSLPSCAQSCDILLQAQRACVPPPNGAAAVSNQGTYTSCFCQSSYLTPLNGPNAQSVCAACPAGDTTTLQSWFSGFCKSGGTNGAVNGQATTSTTSTPTSTKVGATATGTGSSTAGGVTQDTSAAAQHRSWISMHARWVIMLVVLFVGLLLFAFVLWYLHRRYRHKQELGDHSRAPGVQPDMNTWGPGQSVHEFHAPGEGAAVAPQAEKGKEKESTPEPGSGSKRSSRRLKKPWV